MQDNLGFMLRKEFFRIARFPIGHINVTGLGVVDDMLLHDFDFRHPLLFGFYICGKRPILRSGSCRLFLQSVTVQQTVFFQVNQCLGQLLQIEVLRPPRITGTLALLELGLNINQQTAAGFGGNVHAPLLFRRMAPGAGDNGTEGIWGVVLAKSVHADKTFLTFSQQRGNLSILHLIPGLTQQFQQRLETLGILCQSFINGIANPFPMGGLLLIAQPFIVGLASAFGIGHNGVSVLNADGIVQAAHRSGAAPEIPKFALFIKSCAK